MPYEVQCQTQGRWLTDRILGDQDAAVRYAKQRLGSGEIEAARVVEETARLLSGSRERVVFEEQGPVRAKKAVVAASVDSSPNCETLSDVFTLPARLTVGRVLRAYLEQQGIYPTELMATPDQMKLFVRRDELMNQAIGMVAAAQARQDGSKPRDRAAVLYDLLEQLTRFLEATPEIGALGEAAAAGDMAGLEAFMTDGPASAEKQMVALCAVARSLGDAADPSAKIGLLLDRLAALTEGSSLVPVVDDLLAEILDDTGAIRDILGRRGDLADAMGVVVQVLTASRGEVRGDEPVLARLEAALNGSGDLALARRALESWLEKALVSIKPLTREGKPEERAAFIALLQKMSQPGGLVGGGPLSEAMVVRARSTLFSEEEEQKLETAVGRVLRQLDTAACQLGFILDLLQTQTGRKAAGGLMRQIVTILRDVTDLAAFTDVPEAEVESLRADLSKRIESSAMPAEMRSVVLQRLARLKYQEGEDADPAAAPGAAPSTAPGTSGPKPAAEAGAAAPAPGDPNQIMLAAGQTAYSPGDAANCAYRLVSGKIGLSRVTNGKEIPVATLKPGGVFGDAALAGATTRTEKAQALQPSVVERISQAGYAKTLAALATSDPAAAAVILAHRERLTALVKRGVAV